MRAAGHDIVYLAETDRQASDLAIAATAAADDRIVITADYDFGELAVRRRYTMPGVVLLAPTRRPIEMRVQRLASLVADLGERLRGCLTIIEDERVRTRRLA